MSCLFLVGNGFDLNCGLKTRYADIYKGYVKVESNSENLTRFKSEIAGNLENWSDFEMALARYAKTFSKEAEILECITDFTIYMQGHLLNEQEKFYKYLEESAVFDSVMREVHTSLGKYYKGITHNIERWMENRNAGNIESISFCTFNYTNVIDTIISNYGKWSRRPVPSVLHIHGRIAEDPTLGVDNEEQLSLPYALSRKGRRGLIKPIFNNEYDIERVNSLRNSIRGAQIICAFGLSLGESDFTWRNEIIEALRNDPEKCLIFYDFSLSEKRLGTVQERLGEEEDAKIALLKKWGLNGDDDIYGQIRIPCGKNIFNIKEAIEKVKS